MTTRFSKARRKATTISTMTMTMVRTSMKMIGGMAMEDMTKTMTTGGTMRIAGMTTTTRSTTGRTKVEIMMSNAPQQYLKTSPHIQALRTKLKEISTKEKEKVVIKDASIAEANGIWHEIALLAVETMEKDQTDPEKASQKESMDLEADTEKERANLASDHGAKEDLEKAKEKGNTAKEEKERASHDSGIHDSKDWTSMELCPIHPPRPQGNQRT